MKILFLIIAIILLSLISLPEIIALSDNSTNTYVDNPDYSLTVIQEHTPTGIITKEVYRPITYKEKIQLLEERIKNLELLLGVSE